MLAQNPYVLPTIDFVGGSTQVFGFKTYFYANKEPYDLNACTANFAVIPYNDKSGEPVISEAMEFNPGDTDMDGDTATNFMTVHLSPDQTVDLSGKYIYQITIRDASGDVEIPQQGLMYIVNNINKDAVR